MHRLETWYRTGDPRIPTGAIQFQLHRLTMQQLQQTQYDVVVATNLESWPLVKAVRRRLPNCRTILDLHNIESELLERQLHAGGRQTVDSASLKHLQQQEACLSKMTDAAFVCSDHDKQQLQRRSGPDLPIHVIPNGVDCESASFDDNGQKHLIRDILFCGTLDYEPNIAGLNWFLQEVWPNVRAGDRQLQLVVVGRGFKEQNFPSLQRTEGVRLVGAVDSVSPFYKTSGLSICPLLSGSGTRLKILEAMSYGNPVVSTAIGCEGISARHGNDVMLCDTPADFAAAILKLYRQPELFHALRAAARQTVEKHYDWRISGQSAANTITEMHNRRQR